MNDMRQLRKQYKEGHDKINQHIFPAKFKFHMKNTLTGHNCRFLFRAVSKNVFDPRKHQVTYSIYWLTFDLSLPMRYTYQPQFLTSQGLQKHLKYYTFFELYMLDSVCTILTSFINMNLYLIFLALFSIGKRTPLSNYPSPTHPKENQKGNYIKDQFFILIG